MNAIWNFVSGILGFGQSQVFDMLDDLKKSLRVLVVFGILIPVALLSSAIYSHSEILLNITIYTVLVFITIAVLQNGKLLAILLAVDETNDEARSILRAFASVIFWVAAGALYVKAIGIENMSGEHASLLILTVLATAIGTYLLGGSFEIAMRVFVRSAYLIYPILLISALLPDVVKNIRENMISPTGTFLTNLSASGFVGALLATVILVIGIAFIVLFAKDKLNPAVLAGIILGPIIIAVILATINPDFFETVKKNSKQAAANAGINVENLTSGRSITGSVSNQPTTPPPSKYAGVKNRITTTSVSRPASSASVSSLPPVQYGRFTITIDPSQSGNFVRKGGVDYWVEKIRADGSDNVTSDRWVRVLQENGAVWLALPEVDAQGNPIPRVKTTFVITVAPSA